MGDRAESSEPSFDCKRAATVVERLLCEEQVLGASDGQMAEAYHRAMKAMRVQDDKKGLTRSQAQWLRERDTMCLADGGVIGAALPPTEEREIGCFTSIYGYRIAWLQELGRLGHMPDGSDAVPSIVRGAAAGAYVGTHTAGYFGTLDITYGSGGYAVTISTVFARRQHSCDLSGKAHVAHGVLLMEVTGDDSAERCKVTLTPVAGGFDLSQAGMCSIQAPACGSGSGRSVVGTSTTGQAPSSSSSGQSG